MNIIDQDMYPNEPWAQTTPLLPILTKMTMYCPYPSQGPGILPQHYQITAHHIIFDLLQPDEYY